MIIIFGSPGLGSVKEAYQVIHQMIKKCNKPIFPIFPSVVNVKNEITEFIKKGHMAFSDEYAFSRCLAKVMSNDSPINSTGINPIPDEVNIRSLINTCSDGFLEPEKAYTLMQFIGIEVAKQILVKSETELLEATKYLSYPLVQKVVGPLHKSENNGVIVNVLNDDELISNYRRLMQNKHVTGVLIQEMIKGKEVFIGAKREAGFPPLIMCGSGGIYIEALKDHQSVLAPISRPEAIKMVDQLRIKPILQGMRGEPSCNLETLYDALEKVSNLMQLVSEITELDLNPMILNEQNIFAVDIRIRIEK